jgi:cell division protein FtsN
MAKATQATEGDAATDEEAAKKSEALSAPTRRKRPSRRTARRSPRSGARGEERRSFAAAGSHRCRAPASGYEIQLGAFRTMANAAKVRDAVLADFPTTRIDEITVSGSPFYRVRVGPFPTAQETSRAEEQLRSRGFTPVRFNASIKEG